MAPSPELLMLNAIRLELQRLTVVTVTSLAIASGKATDEQVIATNKCLRTWGEESDKLAKMALADA